MEKRKPYLVNKAFNSFLLASLLTVAATQVGATIDGMMLSYWVDTQAMNSVNITRPVTQVMFALGMTLGAGSSMLAGVAIGNRKRSVANGYFSVAVVSVVAVGLLMLLAGIGWLPLMVRMLCGEETLRGVTSDFLGVMLYGSVFYLLSITLEMFVTVDGDPRRVSWAVVVSSCSNLLLDYVFIVHCGWGVSGAAWATVISYGVAVLMLLPHFLKPGTLRFSLRDLAGKWGPAVTAGLPFGLATLLIAVQLWANNNIMMHYFGQSGIVAMSVCVYLLCLSMIILSGTLKAFQPVASILKGAGDGSGVLMVVGRAYRFMTVCLAVFVLPLVVCPHGVARLYGITDASLLETTADAIPVYALNIVFQSVIYLLIPIYQLYGNKKMALLISVGQPLLPVAGLWLLAVVAPAWAWWGLALGQAVVALAVAVAAWIRARCDKSLTPFILVPYPESADRLDLSMPVTVKGLEKLMGELNTFLCIHLSAESALQTHIEVSSEELLKNIVEHAYVKSPARHYVDYRLTVTPEKVMVTIGDDGRPFNPAEYDRQTGLGLLLVRGFCDSLKYDYIFHQNVGTLTYYRTAQ